MRILIRPSLKARRHLLMGCGVYQLIMLPWLRDPLRLVPAGMFPVGRAGS